MRAPASAPPPGTCSAGSRHGATAPGPRSSSAPTSTRSRRTGRSRPVVEDGVVRNAERTILGADNKAAIAAMLEAARLLLVEGRPHAGVELLFTPAGGDRPAGAQPPSTPARLPPASASSTTRRRRSARSWSRRRAQRIDRRRVPRAARRTPASTRRRAGSAILAAARAIADLPLGRIDEETTANVGTIQGGIARNVVPERCSRRRRGALADEWKLEELVGEILDDARLRGLADGLRGRDPGRLRVPRLPASPRTSRRSRSRARRSRAQVSQPSSRVERRRRREHPQRCRPAVRQPRERHGAHPQPGRAHRGRRPRDDGRGDPRARRGGAQHGMLTLASRAA